MTKTYLNQREVIRLDHANKILFRTNDTINTIVLRTLRANNVSGGSASTSLFLYIESNRYIIIIILLLRHI